MTEEDMGNKMFKLVLVYHNVEAIVWAYESADVIKTFVASKLFELGTTSLSDKTTIQVDHDKNFLIYKITPNCELLCCIFAIYFVWTNFRISVEVIKCLFECNIIIQ